MKNRYILFLGTLLFTIACSSDLDEFPPNIASSESLTDFSGVLNAAYYYQLGAVTPMAVMGDFRADNAVMEEEPYPEFDRFGSGLTAMEDQFFGPFYTALYRSIVSANNVIVNSEDATQVGEAKFLRAMSYFKLVQVFGDTSIILEVPNGDIIPTFDVARKPASEVYESVIIPDLQDAIAVLDNSSIGTRASLIGAQSLLGKVYVHRGNFNSAEPLLAAVVNGAAAVNVELQGSFTDIFGVDNDLNSEIIFATQVSNSVPDEYGFSEFWSWSGGLDTKSLEPLDSDLIAAFDASPGDLRRAVTINEDLLNSPKFPQTGGGDHDWIEIRLADVILLYAETLNEIGASPEDALSVTDGIRARAGVATLDPTTLNSQALVRQAIQDERRLELAFEGQRWFDLVRTGTAEAEMGETINANYLVFPVPISEVLASDGVITQNPGY